MCTLLPSQLSLLPSHLQNDLFAKLAARITSAVDGMAEMLKLVQPGAGEISTMARRNMLLGVVYIADALQADCRDGASVAAHAATGYRISDDVIADIQRLPAWPGMLSAADLENPAQHFLFGVDSVCAGTKSLLDAMLTGCDLEMDVFYKERNKNMFTIVTAAVEALSLICMDVLDCLMMGQDKRGDA